MQKAERKKNDYKNRRRRWKGEITKKTKNEVKSEMKGSVRKN